MEIKTLLLPVDGSSFSDRAVEYGLGLAELVGASIVLINCHKTVPKVLGKPNFDEVAAQLERESEEVLQPYVAKVEAKGVPCKGLAVGGATAEAIFDAAKSEKADMIIMGSKGKSDLEGLLIGSVTHRVLHLAPCPVLVIR